MCVCYMYTNMNVRMYSIVMIVYVCDMRILHVDVVSSTSTLAFAHVLFLFSTPSLDYSLTTANIACVDLLYFPS